MTNFIYLLYTKKVILKFGGGVLSILFKGRYYVGKTKICITEVYILKYIKDAIIDTQSNKYYDTLRRYNWDMP